MRCLYCGKELALLKRWTGGGEFCSDSHRQRYQEEYNQLALNRLLQAKPPEEPQPVAAAKPEPPARPLAAEAIAKPAAEQPLKAPAYSAPKMTAAPAQEVASLKETPPKPALRAVEEPKPVPVAPVVQAPPAPPEVVAPAEQAGFLFELPIPLLVEAAPMFRPDLEFLSAAVAALPNRSFEPLNGHQDTFQLETAGRVTFQPSNRASNHIANGSRERRLEVRDFVRTAPVVEFATQPAGETGLETSSEAMDILFFPQPPQGEPVLWRIPPVGFPPVATELGDLGRLSFITTGFCGHDEPSAPEQSSAVAVCEPPAAEAIRESLPIEAAAVPMVEAQPEPVKIAPKVVPKPIAIRVAAAKLPEPVPAPPAEQPQQAQPVPEALVKPLPLNLQLLAPGKAKTVQIFASASSSIDVQVPRSASLPLRPVMILGPAPLKEVEKSADARVPAAVKIEPKKPVVAPSPVRPDPRLASGKLRRLEPEAPEDKKPFAKPEPVREAAPAPKPITKTEMPKLATKPEVKPDVRQDRKPEVKEVKLKEEVRPKKGPEPAMPAPLAAPYPGSGDLGLPHLSLSSSSGFLGNLPMVAKIGIAVALVAGLGTVIAFSSKPGDAASAHGSAGTVVAGSPLPVGDAGWITEWGSDPGVRRTRQISVLRSSQTLTDYRIEMQGQIESKAIGWIYRAADPKNYYVTKLEIVKPGLQPTVAVVRFAVINGEEQARAQLPLPLKVRRDTMYKIRFEAVGSRFTTYVQDEKVDQWTDDHVKTGGVGLYSERGEVASLKGGMSVVPLVVLK